MMEPFDDTIQPTQMAATRPYNIIPYAYGPASLQFGELYLPGTAGPHPVVILIHGGFWRAAYGLTLMAGLAEYLVQAGIAVWNIEYRRIGDTGGGWPGTLLDVARAADVLYTLSSLYELDTTRVVAVGHSAGGHLALWLATRPQLPWHTPLAITEHPFILKGVVSLAGAMDLEQVWRLQLGRGAVAELLGGSPDEVSERYAQASPAALLPLGVPQVLIHGTNDDRVPIIVSQDYKRKATEAGDPVKLIELAGADHFDVIDPTSEAWATTMLYIDALLKGKNT